MIGVGIVLCHFGPGSWYAECLGWDTLGSKLFTAIWGGWTLTVPVLLMTRVNKEDTVLRTHFAEEWDAYAQRTPYKLVPYVY